MILTCSDPLKTRALKILSFLLHLIVSMSHPYSRIGQVGSVRGKSIFDAQGNDFIEDLYLLL